MICFAKYSIRLHKLSTLTLLGLLLSLFLLSGCASLIWLTAEPFLHTVNTKAVVIKPQPVTEIPLRAPLNNRRAELSGLAWYGDHLILLPQWPEHVGNQLFYLNKADIVNFLTNKHKQPLAPQPIRLVNGNLAGQIKGFEGFESIAFAGDHVFLTIEAKPGARMLSHLIAGEIAPDLSEVRLDNTHLTDIEPQTDIDNLGEEAMFLAGDRVITIYEANSILVNREPVAHVFDHALNPVGVIPFADYPYRITDVTPLDSANHFWAINYFFPGDKQLSQRLGIKGLAVRALTEDQPIERLVEFEYTPTGIQLVNTPPITLQLLDKNVGRNWEGIARLETAGLDGFLLATDYYPDTIFAFVAKPK
ncbi:MAG: hypothetical protein U0350_16320 [Caldilineaceae bacterium]